ncbi:MAG: hypothetical protein AB1545_11055 [Thermodesulfobacteriota bacterium]
MDIGNKNKPQPKEKAENLGRNYTQKNNVELASYLLTQISSLYTGKDVKIIFSESGGMEIFLSEPQKSNAIGNYLFNWIKKKMFNKLSN